MLGDLSSKKTLNLLMKLKLNDNMKKLLFLCLCLVLWVQGWAQTRLEVKLEPFSNLVEIEDWALSNVTAEYVVLGEKGKKQMPVFAIHGKQVRDNFFRIIILGDEGKPVVGKSYPIRHETRAQNGTVKTDGAMIEFANMILQTNTYGQKEWVTVYCHNNIRFKFMPKDEVLGEVKITAVNAQEIEGTFYARIGSELGLEYDVKGKFKVPIKK